MNDKTNMKMKSGIKSQIENLKFKMKNKSKSIPQFKTKMVEGNIVIFLWGTTLSSPKYQTHLNLLLSKFKKINTKINYYFFKIIFLWFLLLRFFFRTLSLSLSLSLSLWLNQHSTLSLSLFLSLFLFSPRKFVIRIGDSQCTVGSSDLCLLISFEIKGESALNLFRSLSNFFFLFVNF